MSNNIENPWTDDRLLHEMVWSVDCLFTEFPEVASAFSGSALKWWVDVTHAEWARRARRDALTPYYDRFDTL